MNKLAVYRKKHGLTQRELADILNVTSGAVGMWETGKRFPNGKMLKKIADFFNLKLQ